MLADLALDPHELQSIRSLGLLTLKPVMWAYDVDEGQVKNEGTDPFTIACKIEQEIMDLESPEEQSLYLKELGLSSSGVDRMNRAAYDALGLMSFYTMGEDEVRAWTIRKGTLAPAAAGKVHTDIERGFIRAEIVKYDDLMAAGSEAAVRDAGKVQLKGKDYVIQDGDICLFRFSV
jgi:ribosome-binding ATPase YchF (GTP1/OBG family)